MHHVYVVELNLAELPIISVHNFLEGVVIVVEGKADVPDFTRRLGFLQLGEQIKF